MKLSGKLKSDLLILGGIVAFAILDLMLINLPIPGKSCWGPSHHVFFSIAGLFLAFIGGIILLVARSPEFKYHWTVFIIYCISMPLIVWCINVREFALAIASC